jgi:hypothetical protein
MSTPLSTARPGGPASQPLSQSQVTASVVKFRCLYTHDLRRKSKRWQDGYLKYHAFNKRVMVYDEQGNYIGDHHWRSVDEVQDGDELELDKGALIQVGEKMSTTQTDLSNLFDKRTSQGSPQSHEPASQAPRTSTPRSSCSSQPFRSLNDLLGIKKTPIGHLVSPYEERHPPPPSSDISLPSQRAPKRPKVAPRPLVNKSAPAEVVDLTEPEERHSSAKVRKIAKTHEMLRPASISYNLEPMPGAQPEVRREAPTVIESPRPTPSAIIQPSITYEKMPEVSTMTTPQRSEPAQFAKPSIPEQPREVPQSRKSQERGPPTLMKPSVALEKEKLRETNALRAEPPIFNKPSMPSEKPREAPKINPQRSEPRTFVKPPLPAPLASLNSSKAPLRSAAKELQTEPLGARKLPTENLPVSSRTTSNTSSSGAPMKTLRMATEKPRRKLMYSALLPSDTSQKSSPRPSNPPAIAPRNQVTQSVCVRHYNRD